MIDDRSCWCGQCWTHQSLESINCPGGGEGEPAGVGGIQGASAAQEGFLPLLDVFLDASFTVGPRQMAMPFLPVGSGGQGDRWPSR